MTIAQILAILLFVIMFVLIVIDKIERHYVTLGCGILTLLLVFGVAMQSMSGIWAVLNLESLFHLEFWYAAGSTEEASAGINWATIIFIAGMMVMVEGMEKAGFFRWLCLWLAKLVNYKPFPIFVTFMIMSAVLAMFIDSITVILFLAAVTVELANLLKFDPVSMVLAEIFCANLGGSATMCGDPPNIIIGTSLGYSFGDFIVNTGVMAGVSLVLVLLYYILVFRKEFAQEKGQKVDVSTVPAPLSAIKSKKDFFVSCVIFACAIILLVTHAQTGLTVAFIGALIAVITLIVAGKDAVRILKKVDYKTLLFFVGLFVVVCGLEQTGCLEMLAGIIGNVSHGNVKMMVAIILWISAIASAFVDNIPFAATMIPVIKSLSATQGVNLDVLTWALSMGTDIGGSATPIGASANVVGLSVASKNGHVIGWGRYCKTAVPATILVITVCMIYIFMRYC
ncbi:MAG: anion permease [Lachnospiraceae bacterium]|nr:anion permease [Lachnospiraceae bacterium]